MLHITPCTLILMLQIRQSIYLVLTNVLPASFLMFHITFNEISTSLYNSGYTGCMCDNMFILWKHVFSIFYEDRECCFTHLVKTFKWTYKLSPYSKMNVRLSVQVLSFVSKVLLFFYLFHFWCSTLHLMKSAKHCLYNSSRYTWCMCDNDKLILWNHISSIFHDISCQNFQMNISGWDLT